MRWTIRAKLAALVLAALLPLVAGAAVKFWLDVAHGRRDAQADMLDTALAITRHVDELLSGQLENLELLASMRGLERIEDEDLRSAAARIGDSHTFLHRLYAARPNGSIIATSAGDVSGEPSAFPDPATLAQVIASRQMHVGAPRRGPDGRPVLTLAAPRLTSDGRPVSVLAADLDLQALSNYLDLIPLMHGTSALILTDTGAVVARSGGGSPLPGESLPALAAALPRIHRAGGVAEWRWEPGAESVIGVAPLSRAPWVALAAVPRDLAYAPAAARLRASLLGLGAAMLVALIAAWLVGRGMVRSVRTLIAGARGLSEGTGDRIAVPTTHELAELAHQLNNAMDERRHAEDALAAPQRRIRALAEVNRALSQQLELEPLLQQITEALARLTGAPNVVLWEIDQEARTLTRRTWTTARSIHSLDLPPVLTLDQGGTGWVARHREALYVEDVGVDPRIMATGWALRHGLVAFAGAPVIAGDELLGVLTLNLGAGMLPQGDDRALISSFASQAAVAIHNARLFAEVDARRAAAETLSDLGRVLAQALDVDSVARRVADSVRTLLGARNAGLYRVEPQSGALVALAVSGDIGPGFGRTIVFPSGAGLVGLCVREGKAVATANVLTDPRVFLPPELRARIEPADHRAMLAAPLVVKDVVIGALSIGDLEGRIFDGEEIRIAQAFADQAALALDNARLYEETYQRLRHLDSLRGVVEQILVVPISLEERLDLIARKAADLFDADRASVALWDERRANLVVRAGYGLMNSELGRLQSPGTGAGGVAASRSAPVLVNDYASWPHRDPFILSAYSARPAVAVMSCPLLIRDQLIGTLTVASHTPNKVFSQVDLDRLATLAAPAALAIEHSRLYEELEVRVRELEETQAQLLQAGKLSAVGQLISGVAHELNNSLSVILGYGHLLGGREVPRDLRRPIDEILGQGERMAKIVQNLLLFSRQRKAERGAVDVRQAIEQTLGLRANQLALSGILVGKVYGNGVPSAEGDAHQLQQVFLNLILNAEQAILGSGSQAGRHGDAIHVSTSTRAEGNQTSVVVTIADNGPGIPSDVLPHIFEPFFTTKRVGEGTGLGLSVSYGIIHQHGGALRVESEPGHTVFTVELPAYTRLPRSRSADRTVGAALTGRGRRALVIDDEPGVIELVAALLSQAGWQVESARGGWAALERLRAGDYDVVVSDIRMPEGSGDELYRTVAAERPDVAKRFLFMTGDTANPKAWRFLEEVGAAVIEKPFGADALLRNVERIARAGSSDVGGSPP